MLEAYGVEGVEVGRGRAENRIEGKGLAGGEQQPLAQASSAPESAPTPQDPEFHIQLGGFAAPFTTSKIIGPEDWLTQNINRKNVAGQEGKAGGEEETPGTRSTCDDRLALTNTVRAILVIGSLRSFTLNDVNYAAATTTKVRDNGAGMSMEKASRPPLPPRTSTKLYSSFRGAVDLGRKEVYQCLEMDRTHCHVLMAHVSFLLPPPF